jgi:hypothetical protein
MVPGRMMALWENMPLVSARVPVIGVLSKMLSPER